MFLFFSVGLIYIYQSDQLAKLEILLKVKNQKRVLAKDSEYQQILSKEVSKLGLKS